MRHTFKLLAATVAAATICSCSTLTGYPTDAEASYAKAIEIAKKSVDTDKFKVYSLSFMEGETLSDNLFLISKYPGWDPDVSKDLNPLYYGVDRLTVPQPRMFTFGINITI